MSSQTTSEPEAKELTFQCPICGVQYSHENLVRAHIALSKDSDHYHRNGFMPEDEVAVLNEDGEVIETREGESNQQNVSISTDELPDGLNETDKHIIKTAVRSTQVDTYQELVERANATLRAEGLQERSYTTIAERLKEFFHIEGVDDTEFDNLTEKQQRVLELYDEDKEMDLSVIAEKADVDPSYPNRVIEKFGHLMQDDDDSEDDVESGVDEESVSDELESDEEVTEEPATEMDELIAKNNDSEREELSDEEKEELQELLLKSVEESAAYDGVDVTDTKRKIIEYIARSPDSTNRQVSDAVGCSISYPSRVRDNLHEVILERAHELGTDVSKFEDSTERRKQKRAESWGNLTDKQKPVLRRLAEEDDPKNPDSSLREIIEDLSFDTYPAYVSDVKSKYGDFAVRLKHARQKAESDEEAEEMIDSISMDEIQATDVESDVDEEPTSEEEPSDTEEPPFAGVDLPTEFESWLVEESDISNLDGLKEAVEAGDMDVLNQLTFVELGDLTSEIGVMPPSSAIDELRDKIAADSAEVEADEEPATSEVTDEEPVVSARERFQQRDDDSIESLFSFVQMHKQMAQSEIDRAQSVDVAVGRLVMAEQFENELERITEGGGEEERMGATV